MRFRCKYLLLLLAFCGLNTAVSARVPNIAGKEAFVPGEILVRFREGVSADGKAKALSVMGTVRSLKSPDFYKIRLKPGMDVATAVRQMAGDPSVKYAQPNYRYYALGCSPPTDQYYVSPENWPFIKISAPQAWSLFTSCPPGSASVTVAVMDSGISRIHPDLEGVPLIGYNAIGETGEQDTSCMGCAYSGSSYVDSGGCTYSMDDFGHGTYVSGILGAQWNGINVETGSCAVAPTSGFAGLAPSITLLAIKVLDCTGSGTTDSIVAGTDYAVAHGAKVLNFSLGSSPSGGLDPAEKESLDNALANGCVIAAASGNESDLPQVLAPLDFPAAYPPVIAVGATDPSDQVAFYSNGGANLDIVAPGGFGTGAYRSDIDVFSSFLCPLSAAASQEGGFSPFSLDSNFGTAAGTSAATPFVSATAALIWSLYPNLTNTQVVQAIINNTDSLNGNQGWDAKTGYGRLNVYQALLNAGNGGGQVTDYVKTFNSPNPFYTGSISSTDITLVLSQPAPVELTIYDSSGETVLRKDYAAADLNNNPSNPQYKSYYVSWDGKNGSGRPVVTGIYFYSVKVNGQVGRNKIALIQGTK